MSAGPGFRKTSPSGASKPGEPGVGGDMQAPIAERIINALTAGQPPQTVARKVGVPLDFVSLVTEQARRSGRLNYYELAAGNCGSGPGCDPDPDSLVCASCPILPAAVRRQQSPWARLRARIRQSPSEDR